jgi:hypothetical protein
VFDSALFIVASSDFASWSPLQHVEHVEYVVHVVHVAHTLHVGHVVHAVHAVHAVHTVHAVHVVHVENLQHVHHPNIELFSARPFNLRYSLKSPNVFMTKIFILSLEIMKRMHAIGAAMATR